MPEMNGHDLASYMLASHPGIKRLFMSGYHSEIIAHFGLLADGESFIQKPFSTKDLAFKVREILDY